MASSQLSVLSSPRAQNRRAHPRRRVEKLAYVRFDQDNGGILLDIGLGGLNFQGVAGLVEGEFCQLQFTLPGTTSRLGVTGQVAWSNLSRKGGGIRFVDMPQGARAQIQEWLRGEDVRCGRLAESVRTGREFAPVRVRSSRACGKQPERSSTAISAIVGAILILVFAAVVVLGDSPLDNLSVFLKGMTHSNLVAAVPVPSARAEAAAVWKFQVEAVDLNNRRWILTNDPDGSDPAMPAAQVRPAGFVNAALVHGVRPTAPQGADAVPITGVVRINATIGTDGVPKQLRVLSGETRLLAAALGVIRLWRYRPASLNGEPVESQMVITLNF